MYFHACDMLISARLQTKLIRRAAVRMSAVSLLPLSLLPPGYRLLMRWRRKAIKDFRELSGTGAQFKMPPLRYVARLLVPDFWFKEECLSVFFQLDYFSDFPTYHF